MRDLSLECRHMRVRRLFKGKLRGYGMAALIIRLVLEELNAH